MVALNGALAGFGVGAALALIINLELIADIFQARRVDAERGPMVGGRESDRVTVMRWIKRALLIALPVAFAAIGFASAEELFGGAV